MAQIRPEDFNMLGGAMLTAPAYTPPPMARGRGLAGLLAGAARGRGPSLRQPPWMMPRNARPMMPPQGMPMAPPVRETGVLRGARTGALTAPTVPMMPPPARAYQGGRF